MQQKEANNRHAQRIVCMRTSRLPLISSQSMIKQATEKNKTLISEQWLKLKPSFHLQPLLPTLCLVLANNKTTKNQAKENQNEKKVQEHVLSASYGVLIPHQKHGPC